MNILLTPKTKIINIGDKQFRIKLLPALHAFSILNGFAIHLKEMKTQGEDNQTFESYVGTIVEGSVLLNHSNDGFTNEIIIDEKTINDVLTVKELEVLLEEVVKFNEYPFVLENLYERRKSSLAITQEISNSLLQALQVNTKSETQTQTGNAQTLTQ